MKNTSEREVYAAIRGVDRIPDLLIQGNAHSELWMNSKPIEAAGTIVNDLAHLLLDLEDERMLVDVEEAFDTALAYIPRNQLRDFFYNYVAATRK